jgi:hypothetical protein
MPGRLTLPIVSPAEALQGSLSVPG